MCRNVCGATKVHKGQPGRYVASHISLDSGKLTFMHCRLHAPVFMLGGICVGVYCSTRYVTTKKVSAMEYVSDTLANLVSRPPHPVVLHATKARHGGMGMRQLV